MPALGAPVYNPATGLASIIDSNYLSYLSSTLNGLTTIGATSLVVLSVTGLAVGQTIQVDSDGPNAEVLKVIGISVLTLTVWPATAKNHANGAVVLAEVNRQIVSLGDPSNAALQAGVDSIGNLKVNLVTGGMSSVRLSASVTRPANTTPYIPGDLLANSTTAGSVIPLAFANAVTLNGNCIQVSRVRLFANSASLTNASFVIHLFESLPTVSVGDSGILNNGGVLALSGAANYGGSVSINLLQSGTDGAVGFGTPGFEAGITLQPAVTTVYGLIECAGAYTPTSSEIITVVIEGTNS